MNYDRNSFPDIDVPLDYIDLSSSLGAAVCRILRKCCLLSGVQKWAVRFLGDVLVPAPPHHDIRPIGILPLLAFPGPADRDAAFVPAVASYRTDLLAKLGNAVETPHILVVEERHWEVRGCLIRNMIAHSKEEVRRVVGDNLNPQIGHKAAEHAGEDIDDYRSLRRTRRPVPEDHRRSVLSLT